MNNLSDLIPILFSFASVVSGILLLEAVIYFSNYLRKPGTIYLSLFVLAAGLYNIVFSGLIPITTEFHTPQVRLASKAVFLFFSGLFFLSEILFSLFMKGRISENWIRKILRLTPPPESGTKDEE
jgi:hypothetical protein